MEDGQQVLFERVPQVRGIAGRRAHRLACGVEQLARSADAKVSREQGVFQAAKLLGIKTAVASEQALDARGDLRARFIDGAFEPLQKGRRRFVIAEKGEH